MTVIKYLVLVVIVFVAVFFSYVGMVRGEKVECEKLSEQAQDYPGFFASDAWIETCATYGIEL